MNDDVTGHLTDVEIYELAAGDDPAPGARVHADTCDPCAGRVRETRRILAAVEGLERDIAVSPGTDEGLAPRMGGGRPARVLAAAAAACLCFAAGVVTHALWTGGGSRPATAPAVDASSPTLAIQRTGTAYVAAIARMADVDQGLSGADLRTGREVALAAMSGAAYELGRLGQQDPATSEIRRLAEGLWLGPSEEGAP
ncbi:MAG TPA: hypothetical protein VFV75_08075 [Candidatus Polarisedimenticolaceae bacterium]|nr:hypothetical protein [Candidatus Polarisedimenticolaceae bacterium]